MVWDALNWLCDLELFNILVGVLCSFGRNDLGVFQWTGRFVMFRWIVMFLFLFSFDCLVSYYSTNSSWQWRKVNPKNSKWVWSGNTTITNRRQPGGTTKKSRSTITTHQEDKLSKATSSLFPIKMITILEWT